MKTTSSPLAAVKAVVLASFGLLTASLGLNAQTSSTQAPIGWLTASATVVQSGTKPTLSWGISYPTLVKDFVEIIPPSTINPKAKVDVEVRVLGNGVTASGGGILGFEFVSARATLSFNSGSYNQIFYGTNNNVNPSTVVYSRNNIQTNQRLRFGGAYYYAGTWGTTFTSQSSGQNVRTLVNGDTPPNVLPKYGEPSLKSFIRPYLGSDGKVKIGPMDVIVFMELTHTNENSEGYDLQDMVLLVTFKERK